jgi:cell division protein ZapA
MSEKRIKVNIYGNQYAIYTDEDEKYIQQLAELVDKKMREIARKFNVAGTLQVSILTSMYIADELFQNQTFKDNQERIKHLKDIIQKIEKHLTNNNKI